MTDADRLVERALLELLREGGEVVLAADVSLQAERHFERCPDTRISGVEGEAGSCGNGTCNIGRFHMAVGCPHQGEVRAEYCEYGSLRFLIAKMEQVGAALRASETEYKQT